MANRNHLSPKSIVDKNGKRTTVHVANSVGSSTPDAAKKVRERQDAAIAEAARRAAGSASPAHASPHEMQQINENHVAVVSSLQEWRRLTRQEEEELRDDGLSFSGSEASVPEPRAGVDPDYLRVLSHSAVHPDIRRWVARNPNTPGDVLSQMLEEGDVAIQAAVLRNEATPEAAYGAFARNCIKNQDDKAVLLMAWNSELLPDRDIRAIVTSGLRDTEVLIWANHASSETINAAYAFAPTRETVRSVIGLARTPEGHKVNKALLVKIARDFPMKADAISDLLEERSL